MPLTALQKDVLALLAANRSEESHFAGGVVLNASDDSVRYSHDFDIFHELAEEVARTETRDYVDILELHKRFPLAARLLAEGPRVGGSVKAGGLSQSSSSSFHKNSDQWGRMVSVRSRPFLR